MPEYTFAEEIHRRATISEESVCLEAAKLVCGPRGTDYGHPLDDYLRTTQIFNAATGHKLSALDGIIFMVCVKLSREQNHHKRDNLVDACGYLECFNIAREEATRRGLKI